MGPTILLHFGLTSVNARRGISCDATGAFVGGVPLLSRIKSRGSVSWKARNIDELNEELGPAYGLPIDFSPKAAGLATIARAFNDRHLALAQIATLNLRLPNPPNLEKSVQSTDELLGLAALLAWTGILKGDWDPDEHPRVGGPPNPGWFATKPTEPRPPRPGWPSRQAGQALREVVKRGLQRSALSALGMEVGGLGGWALGELLDMLKETVSPAELNKGEQRLIDQYNAYYDPPKTLDELHAPPEQNVLGYDQHHIVEQNPANVEKRMVEKFGRDKIDDPDNVVWIPRLKHEEITSYYNSSISPEPGSPRQRDIVNSYDFDAQRELGLRMLRDKGVLK